MTLSELRKRRGMTQVQVAGRLGITQPRVSEMEHRDDLRLSTINRYVKALGGSLVISASFDLEVPE